MAKKEYEYKLLITYQDGTTSIAYEFTSKKRAIELLTEEMDDRIWDYVKNIKVISRSNAL